MFIGCSELLAVVLCFYTFRDLLVETFWTCYIDNDGVLASLLIGSVTTKALDINQIVGKLWLELAHAKVGFHGFRLESKANIADIPTREECLDAMYALGRHRQEPVMPDWMLQLWLMPDSAASCVNRP